MYGMIKPLEELESYNLAKKHIKYGKEPLSLTGVIESQKSHLIHALESEKTKLIVTADESKAKEIVRDLKFYENDKVMLYPSKDIIFFNADVHSNDITRERLLVIEKILSGEEITLVMSIEALVDQIIDMEAMKKAIQHIETAGELQIEIFVKELVYMGYERVTKVESRGQFAIRGGIIDVFPINVDYIVRIELWGDEVDSIRLVNYETQRSVRNIENLDIYPAREVVIHDEAIERAIKEVEKDYQSMVKKIERSKKKFVDQPEEVEALDFALEEVEKTKNKALDKMKNQGNFNGIESYITYYFEHTSTILDYLQPKVIFVDEPLHMKERVKGMKMEYAESMENRLKKGHVLSKQLDMFAKFERIMDVAKTKNSILLSSLHVNRKMIHYEESYDFNVTSIQLYHQDFELLKKDLVYYIKNDYRVLLITGSLTRAKRLYDLFQEEGIRVNLYRDREKEIEKGAISIGYGDVHKGFIYTDIRLAVIAETELQASKKKKVRKKKYSGGRKIDHFTELKVGDYIVHENHGVGVFKGLEKIAVDDVEKDYIKISYKDNGNLYISTDQLDSIQKYIGAEGKAPKLNKLGTNEWKRTKSKVKGAVEELAKDLIELYAKREQMKGHQYGSDTTWQNEFEEMFPYDETDDQLNAILDTKKDMESSRIMDRLICGDVGYGKTEVAIRAAFKAVQDGKQVAYLVPTTILAQQHYNNFVQRMKDFPVKVEMLSRFRTKKETKQVIDDLSRGLVDIVIGTHRIVSNDVKFKDLGLLIVDEEQRFGVGHKEKIKKMKETVDVLTLTATPIPRTLHMSLIGVRDMSVLEEPPEERQPIQTYVLEHDDELIKDAIQREVSRGGQVYYLYNRVKRIDEVALKISNLVKDANVSFAHGQMSERELEDIMVDFINGEIDVLVSTTIIETGLDIPNANTIIIQDADRMGLSQLYQLRGRVGRSSRLAYAYLTYKRDKVLQEVAEKRLKAIKEFTEFGSGFKIAMRDLEIRGAGNILGERQHGHMDAVGYELYTKMLEEAVNKKMDVDYKEKFETTIEINVSGFIPMSYIEDEIQKIDAYKKIASIQTEENYMDMQDELIDRYGDIPKSVSNLIEIAYVKAMANRLGILSIEEKNSVITFEAKPDAELDPTKIAEFLEKDTRRRKFKISEKPIFTLTLKDKERLKIFIYMKEFLMDLKELSTDKA